MEIYQRYSYKTELETTISHVRFVKKKTAIACNDLLFHPKGGGQPSDVGSLKIDDTTLNVTRLVKLDGDMFCVTDQKLPNHDEINIGTPITQLIDWDRRYKFMRCHTAAHILMAAARVSIIAYEAKGIEINEAGDECFVRFQSEKLDQDQITSIINRANEISEDNRKVEVVEVESLEAAKKEFGQALRIDGNLLLRGKVSLTIIDDVDVNPCGGTHVKDTSEIGKIELLRYEHDDGYGEPGESIVRYKIT